MNRIRFGEEADREVDEILAWYGEKSLRAYENFEKQLGHALRSIGSDPNRFEKTFRNCQRCQINGFPYSIIFLAMPDNIYVVAVAHGKRRPGYWRDRL